MQGGIKYGKRKKKNPAGHTKKDDRFFYADIYTEKKSFSNKRKK
jgi:hypothetical protein